MKALTSEKLSENRYLTSENYLVCLDAILARTGMQEYLESEVLHDGDDSKVLKVYRNAEDVFNINAIASFENKAVTIDHPEVNVNSENHNTLSVGFVRDVKRKNIKGDDVLVGNIIITNQEAIEVIKDGKNALSCGYTCDVELINGKYYQKNIRGNHVAIVDNPRAGITKIQDAEFPKNDDLILNLNTISSFVDSVNKDYRDKRLNNISKMLQQIGTKYSKKGGK